MTASYKIRFAAFTIAVAMTAVVNGTMLAGFENVAQQATIAGQSGSSKVAMQKVTVTAHKS
jgi:hypothetical protein